MNSIVIAGNVGRDAETRRTGNGQTVTNFSVAVRRHDKEEGPLWFDVAMWGEFGEKMQEYITKGKTVAVQGELTVRVYNGEAKLGVNARKVSFLGGGTRREAEVAEPETEQETEEDVPF